MRRVIHATTVKKRDKITILPNEKLSFITETSKYAIKNNNALNNNNNREYL